MVYLLFGDEDYLIHEELERIRAGLGPQDMVGLNTTHLPGAGLSFPELQANCDTVPFLAPARLVIVEGLMARFAQSRTAGRSSRAARATRTQAPRDGDTPSTEAAPARRASARPELEGGWDQLGDYCRQMPETTHLVFLEGTLNRTNALLAMLSPVSQVREQRKLRGAALEQWVRDRAASHQAKMTPAALKRLIGLVGDNLWVLSSELEKLSLYAEGRPIEATHVEDLVSSARESTIFTVIDAVAERRLPGAQQALHHLLRDGMAPPYVLFRLAGQFRSLLLAKALIARGVTGAALMGRLGITAKFPFDKTVEQSRGYTVATLTAILEHLLETDVAIKTGRLDPEMALELLAADLCQGRF